MKIKIADTSFFKANRIIGKVGFDRITLTKLIPRTDPFAEPLENYFDKKILSSGTTGHTIQFSAHKVKVYGPNYTFSFGNQGLRPFIKLELHASNSGEDNLCNLSVAEVWAALDMVIEELNAIYRLNLSYDRRSIRVYAAEINITFPLNQSFSSYQRILRMLAYASNKSAKKMEVSGKQRYLESFYLISGATKSIKCYDKNQDLKDRYSIDCDCPLMRYEIYGKEQTLSKMSFSSEDQTAHMLHLMNINDRSVRGFFTDSCNNMFSALDSMLADSMNFSIPESFVFSSIVSAAVQHELRADATTFIEGIMEQLHFNEAETGIPLVLDIEDLIPAVRASSLQDASKNLLAHALESVVEFPEHYSLSCHYFLGQRKKYEELRSKLCNEDIYEMTFIPGKDKKFLVWWSNPNHKKIEKNSIDTEPVYQQLYEIFSKSDHLRNYSIFITSNKMPLVYVREDFYSPVKIGTPPYKNSNVAHLSDSIWDEAKKSVDLDKKLWEEETLKNAYDPNDPIVNEDDDFSFYMSY